MRPSSLKRRLLISLGILVIVIITVLSVTAYIQFRETLRRGIDTTLLSQAKAVAVSIAADDSLLEARKEIQAFLGSTSDSEHTIYRVWFEGEQEDYVASCTQEDWPLDWTPQSVAAPPMGEHTFFEAWHGKEPYRLIWVRGSESSADGARTYQLNTIIAAYDGHIDYQINDFMKVMLALGGAITLLSVVATLLILKWGMKPITGITMKMNDITGKSLSQLSSFVSDSPVELKPFVRAWGQMIERLAVAMRQQRRFTADASHELRTPLAIVKSTLQASRSRKRSTEAYESAIDQSLDDLGRLEHLTEQLLALAHLDDIEAESDWEVVDVKEVVDSVCEQYVPLAKQAGGNLTWEGCPVRVNGSIEQLMRLVANLIDNAIKHGPESGNVSVSMHLQDNLVNVLVHDDGGSIPRQDQERIFGRFYRGKKGLRTTVSGSGLGLALAQEIAHKHNGCLTVRSGPKSGTDFVVTLPCI